jgi:hypothetical protein
MEVVVVTCHLRDHARWSPLNRSTAHTTSSTMEAASVVTQGRPFTPMSEKMMLPYAEQRRHFRRHHAPSCRISTLGVAKFMCYRLEPTPWCRSAIEADEDATDTMEVAGTMRQRKGNRRPTNPIHSSRLLQPPCHKVRSRPLSTRSRCRTVDPIAPRRHRLQRR